MSISPQPNELLSTTESTDQYHKLDRYKSAVLDLGATAVVAGFYTYLAVSSVASGTVEISKKTAKNTIRAAVNTVTRVGDEYVKYEYYEDQTQKDDFEI
jgi:hypothetical protein